jgi:hypothetical protein
LKNLDKSKNLDKLLFLGKVFSFAAQLLLIPRAQENRQMPEVNLLQLYVMSGLVAK